MSFSNAVIEKLNAYLCHFSKFLHAVVLLRNFETGVFVLTLLSQFMKTISLVVTTAQPLFNHEHCPNTKSDIWKTIKLSEQLKIRIDIIYRLQKQVNYYVLISSIVNAREDIDSPSNLLNIKETMNRKYFTLYIHLTCLRH